MLIGVMTSGGDAPGMNAAVRAVVRTAIFRGQQVLGIRRGLTGLLTDDMHLMDVSSVGDIIYRGGTILHTGRSEEFRTPEGQQKALRSIRRNAIDAIVMIGGDGSLRASEVLRTEGVHINCIPGTIDNDIAFSDVSIGFDTAVNTVCYCVDKIRDTAEALERTFIVEVMGRESGFIALASGIAVGAESIVVPEIGVDYKDICDRLRRSVARRKKHSVIILAEGAGDASLVAAELTKRTGYDMRVITLGHIQRGGTPTAHDRVLASELGSKAVDLLLNGIHGKFIGVVNGRTSVRDFSEVLSTKKQISLETYELAKVLSI